MSDDTAANAFVVAVEAEFSITRERVVPDDGKPWQAVAAVGHYQCSCCDERYILVACLAEDGTRFDLAFSAAGALRVAELITQNVTAISPTPTGVTIQ